MAKFRKSIRIFLIDGEPTGRLSADISSWTGKAYKIPRNMIKESKDRSELNGPGVYFLFGKDDDGIGLSYIGEAENVLKRLNSHLREKDFWTEVIVFTSKDEYLNKAHIKYLEHHFHKKAVNIGKYTVLNDTIPVEPNISEPDQAEMEEFMTNSEILIGVLGHKLFEEEASSDLVSVNRDEKFYIKATRGADATMVRSSEGFVVLKGSHFAKSYTKGVGPGLLKHREKLVERGVLVDHDDHLLLTKDYTFSSPSTASSMVMGNSSSGLSKWKLGDGRSLRDVEKLD